MGDGRGEVRGWRAQSEAGQSSTTHIEYRVQAV